MIEKLPRLYYLSDNEPKLLPEWAYFFMRLGQQLATVPATDQRFIIGLAIPTRVFACSLVATGIVLARAGAKNFVDNTQQQYILNLKPGTPVHVRKDNNTKLRGVVEKFEEYSGKLHIIIRTAELKTHWFPIDRYASRITVSDRDVSLPRTHQSGHRMEAPSPFLRCCLGKGVAKNYILNISFEALIIGKVSIIHHEVCDIPFICEISSQPADTTGYLQEILRVRQFSGSNKSYRSQCISSSIDTPEKEIGNRKPGIVIFDGAIAYIKHGHKWRNAHQIVLLDRTERQFEQASELLNQNYSYRSPDDFNFPIKIPNSIEMMIYKEQK